ncbi:hypothetical protein EWM64_g3542 [Hericium alpestre]|uniref:HicA protein n=1 Tax=Hericium alpestre TaxID=135208 RepID=A0A4Z0A456_9AGAM|nr:hypothetical protein EWM64_g3542 [Hericium alpestre]
MQTSQNENNGGPPPMKWERFVKMMNDMGFTHDDSPPGSAVRFDPPESSGVRSITFHQPHPNPTIPPDMLKKFAKQLHEYYGWPEDILLEYFEA